MVLKLIEAHRASSGLAATDVEMSALSNRADAGVDAYVRRAPSIDNGFFPQAAAVFQFKLSFPGIGSLAAEVSKSTFLKSKLKKGDRYVVVVGSDFSPPENDECREQIAAALRKEVGAAVHVEVMNAARLLSWLRRHSALFRFVPDAPHAARALMSLNEWEDSRRADDEQFPWATDRVREPAVQVGAAEFKTPGSVTRVSGAPGVGKSRFVMQLLRDIGLANRVSYLRNPVAGWHELGRAFGTYVEDILVVDECSRAEHDQLIAMGGASRLTVITIGSEDERRLDRTTDTIWLEPFGSIAFDELAKTTRHTLPEGERLLLARKAAGYPKLLRVLMDAVQRHSSSYSATNLNDEQVVVLIRRYLSDDNVAVGRAISALALPTYFRTTEIGVLASAVGTNSQQLRSDALDRLDRLALIGHLPGGYYVTPRLLGDWLAEGYWHHAPCDVLSEIRNAGGTADLVWRCVLRLVQGSRTSGDILRRLMKECPNSLLSSVGQGHVDDVVAGLATFDPAAALEWVSSQVSESSSFRTPEIVVRTLARCAWYSNLFAPAARLLATMMVRSPPADAKGGFSRLTDLFGTFLGVTQADGDARLAVLYELANSPVSEVREVAVRCAREACSVESARFLVDTRIRIDDAWRPTTFESEHAYRDSAAAALEKLLVDPVSTVRVAAQRSVLDVARGLVRSGHPAISARLMRSGLAVGGEIVRYTRELRTIEEYDVPKLRTDLRELWLRQRPEVRPKTLRDKVLLVASHAATGVTPDLVKETARELLSGGGSAELDLLFSPDAILGFSLGESVGHLDVDEKLMPDILDRARASTVLRFAAGYVLSRNEAEAGRVLEKLAVDPGLAMLVVEATWLSEPSRKAVDRLIGIIERGSIGAAALEQFAIGGWLLRVEQPAAISLLRAMEQVPAAAFSLAFQLMGPRDSPMSVELEALLTDYWFRVDPAGSGIHGQWEWFEAGLRLVHSARERVLARCVEIVGLALGKENPRVPDEVFSLIGQAANDDPASAWRAVASLLDSAEPYVAQVIGMQFKRHLPGSVGRAAMAWVGASSARAQSAAHFATGVSGGDGDLGTLLLSQFGDDQMVSAILEGTLMSGSFHSEVDFYSDVVAQLVRLEASGFSGVRRWASKILPRVRERLRRAEQTTRAYDEGALPLPFMSDRSEGEG